MKEDLNQYSSSYEESFPYADENKIIQEDYACRIEESIQLTDGQVSLLGLGIGHGFVFQHLQKKLGDKLSSHTLVEGSSEIIKAFQANNQLSDTVNVIEDYFETFESDKKFDAIEMGFVLEHVASPDEILDRYKSFLSENGKLFVAVPNARSLNRQIGHAGGLLTDVYKLSEHDHQLGHKRYFDKVSLEALFIRHNLKILRTEGILLKPLTTQQMRLAQLPEEAYDGMRFLARNLPDMSVGLFVEVEQL